MIAGGQAVGRAFRQAVQQEYRGIYHAQSIHQKCITTVLPYSATVSARNAAEGAGRNGAQAAKASSLTGMSLDEAKQILNVRDLKDTPTILKVTIFMRKSESLSETLSLFFAEL